MLHRERLHPLIEPLEARIAPATLGLINGMTFKYLDKEGDTVQVQFSKSILTAANVGSVFTFDVGAGDQQLETINLTKGLQPETGINVMVSITAPAMGSDGKVNIGSIEAGNISVGKVFIPGDLGKIDSAGIAQLQVISIGAQGIATQAAGGNLNSAITGNVGDLNVSGDIVNAHLAVSGNIKSLEVNNLTGGSAAGSGEITFTGLLSKGIVGGNITGGGGNNSGSISGGNFGTLTIAGSLTGGGGTDSGEIHFTKTAASISVDEITGGSVSFAGSIKGDAGSTLTSLIVADSVEGNTGASSGSVTASLIGTVKIAGDLAGGDGNDSGEIHFTKSATAILIGGNLLGGVGTDSGSVKGDPSVNGSAGTVLTKITVGQDVTGAAGANSGSISATSISSVAVAGALTGGEGATSGSVVFTKTLAKAVLGQITGGGGANSGAVLGNNGDPFASFGSTITSITILPSAVTLADGNIEGGAGIGSGQVQADNLVAITVNGDVIAGSVNETGIIQALNLGTVKISGKLDGTNAVSNDSAEVFGGVTINSVTVGEIDGGAGFDSGMIRAGTDLSSGGVIKSVIVKGNVNGGSADDSGGILATNIKSVLIGQNLIGGTGSGVAFSADLDAPDAGGSGDIIGATIGSVKITGSIEGGSFADADHTGLASGEISGQTIASIAIGGSIIGGSAETSGNVTYGVSLGSLLIGTGGKAPVGGSIIGGSGEFSGEVAAPHASTLTSLNMIGALAGGLGEGSGVINIGSVGALTIGSSKTAGTAVDAIIGSAVGDSGAVFIGGTAKNVQILGSIQGGSTNGEAGYIQALNLVNLNITGNILAGAGITDSGAIRVTQDIGTISVLGSLIGMDATHKVYISAGGQTDLDSNVGADVAIKSVTIGGNVTESEILAGYLPPNTTPSGGELRGVAYNADAQIGTVTIKGILTEGNIVAGAMTSTADGNFGTAGDAKIDGTGTIDNPDFHSRIASVVIGSLGGNSGTYGVVSEEVTAVKVAGKSIFLTPGPDNDHLIPVPGTDFLVNEV